MKIKLKLILDLQSLYPKIKEQNLSLTTNYKFLKIFNALQDESNFYKESLSKLVELYGARDESGQLIRTEENDGIQIDPQYIREFQLKLQELLEVEVIVPDISFNLKELENLQLSIEELNFLFPFISE